MPINRVCFARAAVCRRHGADSVGNSGQREEEESIVKFLLSESLGLGPSDALSVGLAISAPSAPAEPCLAGGGAPSPLGGGAG